MRPPNTLQSKSKAVPSFKKAAIKPDQPKKMPTDCRVTVRFSLEERAKLNIDASGMSQSAYIRQCLFGRHASKRVVPEVDRLYCASCHGIPSRGFPTDFPVVRYHMTNALK